MCSVEEIAIIGVGAAALASVDGDSWASIFREAAERKLGMTDE